MADEATPRTPAERAAVLDMLRRARAEDDAAARRRRDQEEARRAGAAYGGSPEGRCVTLRREVEVLTRRGPRG